MRAGLLLASYWAVRYFAPAALSLWAAKHARKQWDFLSGMMVMAATYAVSMAASYRIWTGPTSTVKMQYPLFHGKVTIPAVVGQWIRHNIGLAKILTKMVSLAHSPCLLVSCTSNSFHYTGVCSVACCTSSYCMQITTMSFLSGAATCVEQSVTMCWLMCSLHGVPGSS